MKKFLLYILSLTIVVSAAVAGTVAYLTSEDSDVNVMTLGNVQIDQIEQQWKEDGTLKDFDNKEGYELYPAVGDVATEVGTGTVNGQDYTKYTIENVVDKIVTVENTGKSDAYVRTWFAFEQGSLTKARFDEVIKMNINEANWHFEEYASDVEITDGKTGTTNKYVVVCATYVGDGTCVLNPEKITEPSLLQVYMDAVATNEDVEAVDGNKNGTYEILVFTQAIQTKGFEVPTTYSNNSPALLTAMAALNEGFSETHPWVNGVNNPETVETPEAFKEAMVNGEDVVLNADIVIDESFEIKENVNIDLNGHTLDVSNLVLNAENSTIENGTISSYEDNMMVPHLKVSTGTVTMKNVDINIDNSIVYQAQGNRSYYEFSGIEVDGGELILDDCDLKVGTYRKCTWMFTYGITLMNNGSAIINGGSITVESSSGTILNEEYAIANNNTSTVTLNNVAVDSTIYGSTMRGKLVVNTTDTTITDSDFIFYTDGQLELNYIK